MSDKVKWRDAKELRERIEELERQLANARQIERNAIEACSIIDAAVAACHDNISDLVMQLVSACGPARAALAANRARTEGKG